MTTRTHSSSADATIAPMVTTGAPRSTRSESELNSLSTEASASGGAIDNASGTIDGSTGGRAFLADGCPRITPDERLAARFADAQSMPGAESQYLAEQHEWLIEERREAGLELADARKSYAKQAAAVAALRARGRTSSLTPASLRILAAGEAHLAEYAAYVTELAPKAKGGTEMLRLHNADRDDVALRRPLSPSTLRGKNGRAAKQWNRDKNTGIQRPPAAFNGKEMGALSKARKHPASYVDITDATGLVIGQRLAALPSLDEDDANAAGTDYLGTTQGDCGTLVLLRDLLVTCRPPRPDSTLAAIDRRKAKLASLRSESAAIAATVEAHTLRAAQSEHAEQVLMAPPARVPAAVKTMRHITEVSTAAPAHRGSFVSQASPSASPATSTHRTRRSRGRGRGKGATS